VTNKEFLLIPSIGRNTKQGVTGEIDALEDNLLAEFKRLTASAVDTSPKTNIEWLFLAQHYGLPTRLLDWSTNPLVALYFAVEHDDKTDACVYVCKRKLEDKHDQYDYKTADYTQQVKMNTMAWQLAPIVGGVLFLRPNYSDQRYLNQRSVFSCPADPFSPLELQDLKRFELKDEWKPALRERLRAMGVATAHIYPGLDGIAKEIKVFSFDPVTDGRLSISNSTIKHQL
jgi:hypothetical protein